MGRRVGGRGGGGGHTANEGMPVGNRLCAMKHAEGSKIGECLQSAQRLLGAAATRGNDNKARHRQLLEKMLVACLRQAVANLPG